MNKLILSILMSIVFLFAACSAPENVPPAPTAPDGSNNLAGQASAGPLEIDETMFSSESNFLVTGDERGVRPVTSIGIHENITGGRKRVFAAATDDYIWGQMYVYRAGSTTSESNAINIKEQGYEAIGSPGWIRDKHIQEFYLFHHDHSTVPVLMYTCSRDGASFDCHDNKWQLQTVDLEKMTVETVDEPICTSPNSIPSVVSRLKGFSTKGVATPWITIDAGAPNIVRGTGRVLIRSPITVGRNETQFDTIVERTNGRAISFDSNQETIIGATRDIEFTYPPQINFTVQLMDYNEHSYSYCIEMDNEPVQIPSLPGLN